MKPEIFQKLFKGNNYWDKNIFIVGGRRLNDNLIELGVRDIIDSYQKVIYESFFY